MVRIFVGSKPIRTKSMELLLDQSLSSKNVKATGGSIQNVSCKQSLTEKEKLLKILLKVKFSPPLQSSRFPEKFENFPILLRIK